MFLLQALWPNVLSVILPIEITSKAPSETAVLLVKISLVQ